VPDIPQIALPLRVANGTLVTVEQGSVDDARGQVLALAVTPPGWLTLDDDARAFGLADQAHAEVIDTDYIDQQIAEHVPDAAAVVFEQRDALDAELSLVGVRIGVA
jgi:hypothetical protein